MKKFFFCFLLLLCCCSNENHTTIHNEADNPIQFKPPPCDAFPMWLDDISIVTNDDISKVMTEYWSADLEVFSSEPSSGYKIVVLPSPDLPQTVLASADLNREARICTIGVQLYVFNAQYFNRVLAHELGHCFGFLHSDPNSGCLMAGVGGEGAGCNYAVLDDFLSQCLNN